MYVSSIKRFWCKYHHQPKGNVRKRKSNNETFFSPNWAWRLLFSIFETQETEEISTTAQDCSNNNNHKNTELLLHAKHSASVFSVNYFIQNISSGLRSRSRSNWRKWRAIIFCRNSFNTSIKLQNWFRVFWNFITFFFFLAIIKKRTIIFK